MGSMSGVESRIVVTDGTSMSDVTSDEGEVGCPASVSYAGESTATAGGEGSGTGSGWFEVVVSAIGALSMLAIEIGSTSVAKCPSCTSSD